MAGDFDNTVPRVPAPPPPRYFAAHQEHFEDVEVGEPVTTENTSFGRFFGEVEDHGVGVATGLYGTKAMQIDAADGPGAVGWHDVGLFDAFGTGTHRRVVITAHMRVDSLPVGDEMHVAWMSERVFAVVPPAMSIGVSPAGDLVSPGLTLESGSVAVPVGQWVRVVLESAEVYSPFDGYRRLLTGVSLWTGEAIENPTTENRAGRLSGYALVGEDGLDEGGWCKFGNHGTWSATAGLITLDAIAIDAWTAAPIENPTYTQPGFNVWNREMQRTEKVELLGEWDGTTVQPLEMLGIWTGTDIEPQPE